MNIPRQNAAAQHPLPPTRAEQRAINLTVSGKGTYLAGRFDRWTPLAVETSSDDEGGAQLLIDLTAIAPANGTDDLLTFHADSVKAVATNAFRASGTIRVGDVEREAQAVFQTPAEHTPFVIVTVPIDRRAYPALWDELEEAAARTDVRDAHVFPRGWLRAPELAAA